MDIRIKTYEEFLNEHEKKYDGSNKCFVHSCDKPAYYEGGDSRFYCGMCDEHSGIRDSYHTYLKDIESRIRARMLWDKDDVTLGSLLNTVTTMLKTVAEK